MTTSRPRYIANPAITGNRWPFRWALNLDRLPRLSFDEGTARLTWGELVELISYLERLGHPGDTSLAELMWELDAYIGKGSEESHAPHHAYILEVAREKHRRYTEARQAAQAAGMQGARLHAFTKRLSKELCA